MTGVRLRFALCLGLFLAWLGWLALANFEKGKHPVLSRSQLLGATRLVVADIELGADGLPAKCAVVEPLKGEPLTGAIEVINLPSALTPGGAALAAGRYLLPLSGDAARLKIADAAASPGYPRDVAERPRVYAWDDATRRQLAALGFPTGAR